MNPAVRARLQLPHIPIIPSSHEQPSPFYKVSLFAVMLLVLILIILHMTACDEKHGESSHYEAVFMD